MSVDYTGESISSLPPPLDIDVGDVYARRRDVDAESAPSTNICHLSDMHRPPRLIAPRRGSMSWRL